MNLIDAVNYYLNVVLATVTVFLVVGAGLLYYLLRVKKITAVTEKIDYDRFERRDITEYVKFEDIISGTDDVKGPGMIKISDYVFVGGISISGYNYATASDEDQQRTMVNAVTFFNVVDRPIQLRQSVNAVDNTGNIERHKKIAEQIAGDILLIQEEYDETVRVADDYVDSPEYSVYEEKIKALQKQLIVKEHIFDEVQEMIWLMERMSGGKKANHRKANQLIFSYVYRPSDFTEEYSKEEIMDKALAELDRMGRSYGEALIRAGLTYRRLSKKELIDLMRKQMCPVTSEEIKLEDLFEASFDTLFVTSDSLLEFEIKKREEEAFQQLLAQREQDTRELINQQRLDSVRAARRIQKEVSQRADEMEVNAG